MAHEELKKQYEEDCKNHNHPWSLWEFFYETGGYWRQCVYPSPDWHPDTKYRRKEPVFVPEYFSGLNWRDALSLDGNVVEASIDAENWELIKLEGFSRTTNNRFRSVNGHVYTYIRTCCPEIHAHPTNKNKKFKLHDAVLVYDRHRFAIPLKAEIVEFSSSNDGVRLLLHETNNPNYPKGCSTVWVHEAQLRKIDSLAHPTITIGGVELPRPEVEAPEYGTAVYIFAPEVPKKYFSISWHSDEMNDSRIKDGVVHLTEDRVKEWGSWWQNTVAAAVQK
jgi:hypothetical protein